MHVSKAAHLRQVPENVQRTDLSLVAGETCRNLAELARRTMARRR